jgi:hypothetical protein
MYFLEIHLSTGCLKRKTISMANMLVVPNLSDNDKLSIDLGAEALASLQAGSGFDQWLIVGRGLATIRKVALALSGATEAKGGMYNYSFARLCAGTSYVHMEKNERSSLLYCMDHLDAITQLRLSWSPSERAKINHPSSMRTRLRQVLNQSNAPHRSNASPTAILKDELEEAKRKNADLEERLAAAETEAFDIAAPSEQFKPEDSAASIARRLIDQLGQDKAKSVAKAINEEVRK